MLNTTTEEEATGTAAGEDGMVDVGTVETEPLLVSVLGSGYLAGHWLGSLLSSTLLRSTRLRLRPCSNRPTTWYWCDPYQQYYPYVATCPAPWRQVVQ